MKIDCKAVIGFLACVLVVGCSSQQRYETPEAAATALATAAASQDRGAVRQVFGPRTDDLRSGDPEQDQLDIAAFRRAISTAVEIERRDENSATLLVGEERWPFAVPLVREPEGWRFDTEAGIEELDNRRIGRNELRNIAACRTLIDAQAEYRRVDRDGDGILEYAQRVMSSPGAKDGLYWASPGGVDPSPIGPVLAAAATQTDEAGVRLPYFGYRYRMLPGRGSGAPGGAADYMVNGNLVGGWAVIAWPDEYDVSGVMSFMVSDQGVVYEADLGPDTETAAAAIAAFDPSGTWKPVAR